MNGVTVLHTHTYTSGRGPGFSRTSCTPHARKRSVSWSFAGLFQPLGAMMEEHNTNKTHSGGRFISLAALRSRELPAHLSVRPPSERPRARTHAPIVEKRLEPRGPGRAVSCLPVHHGAGVSDPSQAAAGRFSVLNVTNQGINASNLLMPLTCY